MFFSSESCFYMNINLKRNHGNRDFLARRWKNFTNSDLFILSFELFLGLLIALYRNLITIQRPYNFFSLFEFCGPDLKQGMFHIWNKICNRLYKILVEIIFSRFFFNFHKLLCTNGPIWPSQIQIWYVCTSVCVWRQKKGKKKLVVRIWCTYYPSLLI